MSEHKIGVIMPLAQFVRDGPEQLEALDLHWVQLNCWDVVLYTEENLQRTQEAMEGGIKVASLWAGWGRPAVWDFLDGPLTLGIVPAAYRAARMEMLKRGADFAGELGLTDVTTHMGFIPENPATTEYREVVAAVRELALYCRQRDLFLNFETGQETPTTLMRIISDVGTGNLGINLDPANLLLYGKANPVDAVDIFQGAVRGVHVKDGEYPTDPRYLGEEKPVGEGRVGFERLVPKLLSYGYEGAWIIEREISGPQQEEDIRKARALMEDILQGQEP
ncbi:MAG: sugar phosphate isomerase/epimerase family protein [Anaerolineae bacterium]